jgi:hypothetical protein
MSKKTERKQVYKGLTVNERLMVSGLLEKFHAAAQQRKRDAMIAMLRRVALTEQYATRWVDTMLGDQTFFYH